MAVSTWLSAIGHLVSDIAGAIIGARIGGEDWRKRAATEAASEIRRVLLPDREDIMKELLHLGDEAEELVRLLKEANRAGFILEQGTRYTENWIVNMLLKIEPQDRQWVYPLLNEICVQDRAGFFTFLSILYNDGLLQWLRVAKAVAEGGAGQLTKKLKPYADNLAARAAKKPTGRTLWLRW